MRFLRVALALAFTLFLAIPLSAQTARDSVAVSRIRPDLDALLLHDRQLCKTKNAPAYKCKTAPLDTMRERHVLAVFDSLLRAPTPTPVPVPPPTPLPPRDSGSVAIPPELPRVVPMSRDPYASKPCTVNVAIGADANVVVAAARGGAVLCFPNGYTFANTLYLPARSDSGYVVLRGCVLPEGTRITPTTATTCPTILAPGNAYQAVVASSGASDYVIRGFEISTASSVTLTYGLVVLGDGTQTLAQLPNHILLEQDYIHANATADMQRCVQMNGAHLSLVDSWVSDCHGHGYEAQAVGGWSGTGPYLITNNYLEGAGENVLFGGAAPFAEGLVESDITITRNWIRTPIAWKGVFTKKLAVELKVCHRCLLEANVIDGSWVDAQTGYLVWIKSSPDAPFHGMNSEDITVRYNRITHGASGIAVTGRENYARPDYITLYASERTQRIRIEGNWLDSVNVSPYTGGDARLLLVGGVTNGVGDLAIVGNTIVSSAPIAAFIVFTSSPTAPAVERFDVQRNVFTEGNYGAFADGGLIGSPAFTAFAVPYTFTNNTLIGGTHGYAYPATTTLVSAFTLDTAKVLAATAGVRP